ncbi:hypothetical protein HMPREF1624_07922 [Sporothrix schenckii ATCC 58251]|uniref:Pentatricopeptide repeat protein n=1 Tax=Sporothrix schenckii (strain ATCC 58251 / de Perez 2211183) TaxID=1391915 RepID=U7PMV3_SPOS1|nr:hypothetical protein HMPREF1624_07922 [Sporothrix schenckii ATCC 58251]
MKASRRINRSVCGAVLSARMPPPATAPVSGRSPPSRCIHEQSRRPRRQGRPRTTTTAVWFSAAGAADPASGTLLPMLFPPAWNDASWQTPTTQRAMHFYDSAFRRAQRTTRCPRSSLEHRRSGHTSTAAASQPPSREFDDIFNDNELEIKSDGATTAPRNQKSGPGSRPEHSRDIYGRRRAADIEHRDEEFYDIYAEDYDDRDLESARPPAYAPTTSSRADQLSSRAFAEEPKRENNADKLDTRHSEDPQTDDSYSDDYHSDDIQSRKKSSHGIYNTHGTHDIYPNDDPFNDPFKDAFKDAFREDADSDSTPSTRRFNPDDIQYEEFVTRPSFTDDFRQKDFQSSAFHAKKLVAHGVNLGQIRRDDDMDDEPGTFPEEIHSSHFDAYDSYPHHGEPYPESKRVSKEELLALVGPPLTGDSANEYLARLKDPDIRRHNGSVDDRDLRVVDDNASTETAITWDDVQNLDVQIQEAVRALDHDVVMRLKDPSTVPAELVYQSYLRLPGMRMSYVPDELRHGLLRSLNMEERKNAKSMLRFFAVVADIKDCGLPLLRAEWNAAMAFAGRYVGWTTSAENMAVVNLWREMEKDAGIRSNEVTFNILFDVASKSHNFTLAEMIYDEMLKRGLRFNRYHHVSLIHYFGLRLDPDGIRAAFHEMVEAGEMIDTVVLNCVMSGFVRCGEEDAAERIYTRMHPRYRMQQQQQQQQQQSELRQGNGHSGVVLEMKPKPKKVKNASPRSRGSFVLSSDASTGNPPFPNSTDYKSERMLSQVLVMLAHENRYNDDLRAAHQALMPIRPTLSTFRVLINHHACRLGNLPAVTRYLDDMKSLGIPLHGSIFQTLFKGFALHGGAQGMYTDWSVARLRSTWAALLKALDDGTEGMYISVWLVMWVLRAFDRCATPEMVFKAYNSLMSRWTPDEVQSDFAISVLHSLLKGREVNKRTVPEEVIGSGAHNRITNYKGLSHVEPRKSVLKQLGWRSFQ